MGRQIERSPRSPLGQGFDRRGENLLWPALLLVTSLFAAAVEAEWLAFGLLVSGLLSLFLGLRPDN